MITGSTGKLRLGEGLSRPGDVCARVGGSSSVTLENAEILEPQDRLLPRQRLPRCVCGQELMMM